MDFGNMITPIPASYLINMVGRKLVIHFTGLIFIGASLLTIFAHNMWYIYVARLLAGMGKGVVFGVIPVYLTEVAQVSVRGTLGSLFITAVSLGSCYGYVMGAYLSYNTVNLANLSIASFFLVIALFLPETPFYLIMKGKEEDAERSLAVLRQVDRGSASIIQEMDMVKNSIEISRRGRSKFTDIATSKAKRRALLIVIVTSLIQRLSGISPILAFGSVILPRSGGGLRPEVYMIIFSAILIVGNYVGALFTETCGRKKLLIYSALICGVVNFIFAGYYTSSRYQFDLEYFTWIPYVCLLLYGIGWSIGLGIMPPFLASELFPIGVKSYASSISSIIFGVTSLGVNKVFGEVYLLHAGLEGMFYFFGSCCFLFSVFCVYYVIETKGKTFQEIHSKLQDITGEGENDLERKC